MTKEEFCEYAQEEGCTVDGKIVRNTINGRYTRIDDSFDEERDLQAGIGKLPGDNDSRLHTSIAARFTKI